MTTKEQYPHWTDILGQTYRPGDYVAIAVINDKSPQLVIGRVISINKFNSKGELISDQRWFNQREGEPDPEIPSNAFNIVSRPAPRYTQWSYKIPSCTVTVEPLVDSRGFYRGQMGYYDHELKQYIKYEHKKIKNVTYQIPKNIIKVDYTE